jgi:hypothetical protein
MFIKGDKIKEIKKPKEIMLVKTKKLWPIKIATCHKKILFTYFIL